MKSRILRVWTLSVATSSFVMCAGCEEEKAKTAPAISSPAVLSNPVVPATNLVVAASNVSGAPQAGAISTVAAGEALPPPTALERDTTNATPAPRIVQTPAPPASLKLSPALTEIIKLVQAGVSEEVMLTYIINSTNVYHLGSDEIVYLNDLGVSTEVVTALIQKDTSPEALAQKQAATAAAPLPPGVALNKPAANVYPPTSPSQSVVNPPDGTSVTPTYEEEPAPPTYVAGEAPAQPVNVSNFYNSLAPYGSWVDVDGYGLCWQPTVAVANPYWRPYSDRGRWLWSDSGWYWYSDYSWGWAPFHYGRWCSYPRLGWIWRPDTVWGPSWVTWRNTPYHCGWAPLPPECHYVNGFGLYYQNSSVGLSFGFGLGASYYTFLPLNRFCDRNPHHYYLSSGHAATVYQSSTVINNIRGNGNTIINEGIGREKVARVTRGEIPKVAIREVPLTPVGTARPERLESDGNSVVVVRPKLPHAPPLGKSAPGLAARTDVIKEPVTTDKKAASGAVALTGLKESSSPETSSAPSERPGVARPGGSITKRPGGKTAQPESQPGIVKSSEAATEVPVTKEIEKPVKVSKARPRIFTAPSDAKMNSAPAETATTVKSGELPVKERSVVRPARPSLFSSTTATANEDSARKAKENQSRAVARLKPVTESPPHSGSIASSPLASPTTIAAPRPIISIPAKSTQTPASVREPTRVQSSAGRPAIFPGADVGNSASRTRAQGFVPSTVINRPLSRPVAQPQTIRPLITPSAASKADSVRVYAEPSRSQIARPQIAQPQRSYAAPVRAPSVTVPVSRPQYSAPPSIAAPAVRSAPVYRPEPVRPQISAPARIHSAPTPSAPVTRPSSSPPSSSGNRRDDQAPGKR